MDGKLSKLLKPLKLLNPLKLLKRFSKRKKGEDDDDEDFGLGGDEGPKTEVLDDDNVDLSASKGVSAPPAADEDVVFPDEDDDGDEDEDEQGGGGKRRKLMFIAAGGGILLLGTVAGLGFWFLGGEGEHAAASKPLANDPGRVEMVLPRRGTGLNAFANITESKTPEAELGTHKAEPGTDKAEAASEGAVVPEGETAKAKQEPTAEADEGPQIGGGSLNAFAGKSLGPGQGLVVPSVTAAAYRKLPILASNSPLAKAPDTKLLERVDGLSGPLPAIDKQGRESWQVYSRPVTGDEEGPQVAIMVTGLGLSRAATMAAIRQLPPEVSLAFVPYAKDLSDWMVRSRLAGHEVFVMLPMESSRFPAYDAGPLSLSSSLQVAENITRLNGVLSSFAGYVGVISSMGSKFGNAEGQLKLILEEIKKRGLMFVDGGIIARSPAVRIATEGKLPNARVNAILDNPPEPGSVSRKLRQFENIVKRASFGIASLEAYPSSIESVAAWLATLKEKKIALVPVSAIADKQPKQ